MGLITIHIAESESGLRLDRLLADRLETPRNQIQQWIREGHVLVDGKPTKSSYSVLGGEQIECTPPERDLGAGLEPEAGELCLLYQDSAIAVLDKPAGLVVHPGAGHHSGTLVHRLLSRYPELATVGGSGRPGIVHRLDKDTSGVMVIARTPRAYEGLSRAFAERHVQKTYMGIVYGRPSEETGSIDSPIGRHPTRRKEMAVRASGKPALTSYRCLASSAGISILEIDLATGRTHQIRVHLKSAGYPLIGDPTYGEARWKARPRKSQNTLREFPRPALHAWRIRFTHPIEANELEFEAPLPEDLHRLWEEATLSRFPDLG